MNFIIFYIDLFKLYKVLSYSFYLHSILEWKKKEGEVCISTYGGKNPESFDTLEQAKQECLKDESCYKISDSSCTKAEQKLYVLCNYIASEINFGNRYGCTYKKPGK